MERISIERRLLELVGSLELSYLFIFHSKAPNNIVFEIEKKIRNFIQKHVGPSLDGVSHLINRRMVSLPFERDSPGIVNHLTYGNMALFLGGFGDFLWKRMHYGHPQFWFIMLHET